MERQDPPRHGRFFSALISLFSPHSDLLLHHLLPKEVYSEGFVLPACCTRKLVPRMKSPGRSNLLPAALLSPAEPLPRLTREPQRHLLRPGCSAPCRSALGKRPSLATWSEEQSSCDLCPRWMESYPLAAQVCKVKCDSDLPKEKGSGCSWETAPRQRRWSAMNSLFKVVWSWCICTVPTSTIDDSASLSPAGKTRLEKSSGDAGVQGAAVYLGLPGSQWHRLPR